LLTRLRSHNASRASRSNPLFLLRTDLPECIEGAAKQALKPLRYDGTREIYFVKLERLVRILESAEALCSEVADEIKERRAGAVPLSSTPLKECDESWGGGDDVGTITTINSFVKSVDRNKYDNQDVWAVVLTQRRPM
jgi:hypothetical protein